MFALTLEKIPSVVDRIDMDIEMVNSSFNMNGTFPGRTGVMFLSLISIGNK